MGRGYLLSQGGLRMAEKNHEVGVYVNITPTLDKKLSLMAKLLPITDGKRWFKKDIIAKACEIYAERFFALLEGADGINEMMDMAKEIDPNAIGLETETATENMSTADSGLRDI